MRRIKVDQLDREYPEERTVELHKKARAETEEKLKDLLQRHKDNPQMLIARWADIREMVSHLDTRIRYWEDRRTQFLQLTTAILGVSIVAVVSIVQNTLDASDHLLRLVVFAPVLVPSIILVVCSIRTLALWNKQNNPSYPFTKGYKTWRWQYRHAEETPIDTDVFNYTRDSFAGQVDVFVQNLIHYKTKTLDADIGELIDQDLSQLFLLITNEKFKIKFVSALRDSLLAALRLAFWSLVVSFLVPLVYLVWGSCLLDP